MYQTTELGTEVSIESLFRWREGTFQTGGGCNDTVSMGV